MISTLRSESDWLKFKQEWGIHYQNAKHILAYMNSYPKVLTTLRMKEIYNPDNLERFDFWKGKLKSEEFEPTKSTCHK